MEMTGQAGIQHDCCGHRAQGESEEMTLSRLRHDIRNQLNAIKLSCALLQRRQLDQLSKESVSEVDHAADEINRLVNLHLTDEEAPGLIGDGA